MRRAPVTYTFGYWGWGTNTRKLVKLATEWEVRAGRRPPLWVDVRWSRAVRAPGFRGDAFARATGRDLYTWMRGLGNSAIADGGMQIPHPSDVGRLLDVILQAHGERRRVIVFCACQLVRVERRIACHRAIVSKLLLAAARRGGRSLTVVEWPDGDPVAARA